MELKDFVKKVVTDLDAAVSEAAVSMARSIRFTQGKDGRTITFDIAVSADETNTKSGKAGVKVLRFAEAGGNLENQQKNSTVSRVVFGLLFSPSTKEEDARAKTEAAIPEFY